MEEIQGTSILIVGYGREGKSVEAWLTKHYPQLRIATADKQKDGEKYLDHIADYDTVIRSPGVSPYQLARARYVTSATNIFFSRVRGRSFDFAQDDSKAGGAVTIGVTGTKGKSTTTSLIAHILSAHYKNVRLVGNIGKPMLDELDSSTQDSVFVIELSSHQLVDIRYSPHIAVLLAIVPEHLDYYPNFEAYKQAKENIFRFQKQGDHLIRSEITDETFTPHRNGTGFTTNLLGNQENIAVAVRVARLMRVPEDVIQKQLRSFTPLPHRLEFIGEFRGIRFYNDSLATIPEATIHALNALGPDVTTLIAGGYDRGLSYEQLGAYLSKSHVKTLILFPNTGEKIKNALAKYHVSRITYHAVKTMEEAITLAYMYAPKGDICLLSPASASYNLFRDYADRGDQFKEWVQRIGVRR